MNRIHTTTKKYRFIHSTASPTLPSLVKRGRHMTRIHVPGYPRMGPRRELKAALESFWRGDTTEADLAAAAHGVRDAHWAEQARAGLDCVTAGDFSLYD